MSSPNLRLRHDTNIAVGEPHSKNRRPCVDLFDKREPHANIRVDITVTLTFIRIMDQSAPINPSKQSTLIDRPKRILSRIKSGLSVFSWISYFANQVGEIGSIDTLAPLFLHSSMIDDQIRSWWAKLT